jgi:CBS domain-containing protein
MEQGFNPAILIKEMRKSTDLTPIITLRFKADVLLQRYIDQEVNMLYIMKMMTGINNVLLCKLIEFAIKKLGSPPCGFAWLGLGSQGRGEQMLRTDQDHALVYEDAIDEEGNENSRQYFIQLAKKVSGDLERFGFTSDIADISTANPEYCLSISEWKEKFTKWIKQPEPENILLSNIFFDFSVAFGDDELGSTLRDHLHAELGSTNVFLPYLAKNALSSPPPLSFFRNFIVESSGEHKDEFDLKLRAMMPLVDAARVLSLEHKLENTTNTIERFQNIASSETHHHELINELSDAYLQLMAFRTRLGLQNKNSGRYIRITELSKLERSILRNIFNLINDVLKVLKLRFHTNQIQA